jgi:hypothetical protein
MSKGPGRIERAIRALFDTNPDRAFITDELVEHCYPGAGTRFPIEKKHTVAVLRAAHKVVARDPDWQEWPISLFDPGEGHDSRNVGLCFFNMDSVESYALGRLIACDVMYKSRRPSPMRWRWKEIWDFAELRAMLDKDEQRELMAPGGAWHRFVEMHRAERDNDAARAALLQADQEADFARAMGSLKSAAEQLRR